MITQENLNNIYQEISQGKAKLLDVREQEEWHKFKFKNACLSPLSQLKKKILPTYSKEQKIYLHCRAGKRSLIAKDILQKNGFFNVIALEYTLNELINEGFIVD